MSKRPTILVDRLVSRLAFGVGLALALAACGGEYPEQDSYQTAVQTAGSDRTVAATNGATGGDSRRPTRFENEVRYTAARLRQQAAQRRHALAPNGSDRQLAAGADDDPVPINGNPGWTTDNTDDDPVPINGYKEGAGWTTQDSYDDPVPIEGQNEDARGNTDQTDDDPVPIKGPGRATLL